MPTVHQTPPMQYLPAFVSAARHCSFKIAAKELNVSPSAISQQIKSLESHIGVSLFSRKKRELQLTKAGERFYKMTQKILTSYESGYSQFVGEFFSSTLKVSMIPYIANEVVIPQLYDFQQQCPDLNLVVQTSMRLENLESEELDAAIRFGRPPWENYDAELICQATSGLLATATYFNQHPIKTLEDWQQQTLIHVRSHTNDWQKFMSSINFQFTPKKELYFDSYGAGLRAAEEGLGIVMGVFPISNIKIRCGQLSALSKQFAPIEEAFYLVTKPNDSKRESYQELLSWLRGVFEAL